MGWTVVIPAKALPAAKSRLLDASPDAAAHRDLVLAIRADTVSAARTAAGVTRVVLVVDRTPADLPAAAIAGDGAPVVTLVQARTGLNGALADAAAHAQRHWPGDGVAALVGDLPALRPGDLADTLAAAAAHPHAFVPDADGTGTTLLTAAAGRLLGPRFGPGSAARHAQDGAILDAPAPLRCDVDTAEDLDSARLLGLGPATAAVLAWRAGASICSP